MYFANLSEFFDKLICVLVSMTNIKGNFLFSYFKDTTIAGFQSIFFVQKRKAYKEIVKMKANFCASYWFWKLIIPFFSGTQFTGAVAWFNANPWPKSTLKKLVFINNSKIFLCFANFFCKTTPPEKTLLLHTYNSN